LAIKVHRAECALPLFDTKEDVHFFCTILKMHPHFKEKKGPPEGGPFGASL
jgi:hypothetical protein